MRAATYSLHEAQSCALSRLYGEAAAEAYAHACRQPDGPKYLHVLTTAFTEGSTRHGTIASTIMAYALERACLLREKTGSRIDICSTLAIHEDEADGSGRMLPPHMHILMVSGKPVKKSCMKPFLEDVCAMSNSALRRGGICMFMSASAEILKKHQKRALQKGRTVLKYLRAETALMDEKLINNADSAMLRGNKETEG